MDWRMGIAEGVTALFLLAGTAFDVKSRELPAGFLFGFLAAGILWNLFGRYQSFFAFFGGCLLGGAMLLAGRLTKEAIGYGDGLGVLVIGVFLGGRKAFLILSIAFLFGSFYGIYMLLSGNGKVSDTMPFFPCLLTAALGGILI